MDRATGAGIVLYAALMASLATDLYEPLESGRDDFWAITAMVLLAHAAVGAAVGRLWVLALPVIVAIALYAANADHELSGLYVLYILPILAAATVLGVVLGRRVTGLAAAAFALALVPVGWAAVEQVRRGPPLPAAVQRTLPIDLALSAACLPELNPDQRARVEREAEVLLRELREHPQRTVAYDGRTVTVRELAQESLDDMRQAGPACGDLERRLRAAL